MLHRHCWLVVALLVLMGGMPSVSPGQEGEDAHPSAQQLLEQGLLEYAQGDLEAAQRTLARVDEAQLPLEERVRLLEARQDVARRLAGAPPAARRSAERPDRGQAELARQRRQIDEAAADITAGRLDAAERKLQAVRRSRVELPWFDSERINRMLAQVAERRRVAPPALPTEPEPLVIEPPAPPEPVAAEAPGLEPRVEVAPEPAPEPDMLTRARLFSAQEQFALGRDAEQEGNYRVAAERYATALQFDPDHREARQRLEAVQTRLAVVAGGPPRDLLEQEATVQDIQTQAIIAEFRALMERADRQLAARNFAAAAESATAARLHLDRHRLGLPTARYESLRESAVGLAANIEQARTEAQARADLEIQDRRDLEQRERTEQIIRERQDEVQRLLLRALEHQRVQEYDQAKRLVQQALHLDPLNPAADLMQMMLHDADLQTRAARAMRSRNEQIAEQMTAIIEASTPYNELVTYPPDWPQLTHERLRGLEAEDPESEENRRALTALRRPIPVDFDDSRLVNVIEYFRNITNLNFYVNWTLLRQAGVEPDSGVTLTLTNTPADVVLRLVLDQVTVDQFNPIGYSVVNGIVTISTTADLTRATEIRLYDVRDLVHFVPVPEDVSGDIGATGATGLGGGRGGAGTGLGTGTGVGTGVGGTGRTTGGGAGRTGGTGRTGTTGTTGTSSLFGQPGTTGTGTTGTGVGVDTSFMLDELATIIENSVGNTEDWLQGTSTIQIYDDNLIVSTTLENHRTLADLLAKLREIKSMQISVEARFLLVDQNFLDEFGMDLDFQVNNPGGRFTPIRVAQDTLGLSRVAGSGLAVGQPFPSGSVPSFSPFLPPDPDVPGQISGGFVPGSGFPGLSGRSLDINVGYLGDDLMVNLLITASQGHRRSVQLQAPRVTFLNGKAGLVNFEIERTIVAGITVVPDGGSQPETAVIRSGMTFHARGTISADRRYVILTTRPILSSDSISVFSFTSGGGVPTVVDGNVVFTPPVTNIIQLPVFDISEVDTTVRVPDKGTVMMGGMRQMADVEIEAGVPVLSKIPILNRFFTNKSQIKDERTVLILIKPTIIIQDELEEELYPGLLANPAQFQAGRRFGP